MRRIVAVAILISGTSHAICWADSYATTYVCVDEKGRKAAQDHPCAAGTTQTKTVDTVHHTPTIEDWVDDINRRAKRTNCNYHRETVTRMQDANRTELNKSMGNLQRQNLNADRRWIADNCH